MANVPPHPDEQSAKERHRYLKYRNWRAKQDADETARARKMRWRAENNRRAKQARLRKTNSTARLDAVAAELRRKYSRPEPDAGLV